MVSGLSAGDEIHTFEECWRDEVDGFTGKYYLTLRTWRNSMAAAAGEPLDITRALLLNKARFVTVDVLRTLRVLICVCVICVASKRDEYI